MGHLGERIKARRIELGLNQTALAARAGISKTFLCELENQKRRVGAEILLKLGTVLGMSLDTLMSGTPSEAESTVLPERLPGALMTFASNANLGFNETLLLYRLYLIVVDGKPKTNRPFDWAKFHKALKPFI